MKRNKLLEKLVLLIGCSIIVFGGTNVYAWDVPGNSDLEAFVAVPGTYPVRYTFNPTNKDVQAKGLHNIKGPDGQPLQLEIVDYGRELKATAYLPVMFDSTMGGGGEFLRYTNTGNASVFAKYLKGGAYNLTFSNGATDPLGHNADADLGPNTGHIYANGFWGEPRYIGYSADTTLVENPYYPDDATNNVMPWDRNWQPFGSPSKHQPTLYNKDAKYSSYRNKLFGAFIDDPNFGANLVKKNSIFKDPAVWNKYFKIESTPDALTYQITGYHRTSNGRYWYETFLVPAPITASTYIMNMELTDIEKPIARVGFAEGETSGFSRDSVHYQGLRSWALGQENLARSVDLPVLKHNGAYSLNGDVKYYHRKDNVSPTIGDFKVKYTFNWLNKETGEKATTEAYTGFVNTLTSNQAATKTNSVSLVWPTTMAPTDLEVVMELPTKALKESNDDFVEQDNIAKMYFKIGAPQDMAIPDLELFKDGIAVEGPLPGEEHELTVTVTNKGTDTVEDPTVDVTIKDKNGNTFFEQIVPLPGQIIPPGGSIKVPVDKIVPPSMEIEACAIINQAHTDKKENVKNANDKHCEKFKTIQDMGISDDIILKNASGAIVTEYAPGANHTIIFKPKHVGGPQAVGLDPTTNPLTTIDVTIADAQGKTFYEKTLSSKEILNPKGMIEVPIEGINQNTTQITACATVNKKHTIAGYNIVNDNDRKCKTFGSTKNYSMRDLRVNPPRIHSPGGAVKPSVTFTYTMANESSGDVVDKPWVVLKQDGKEIWKERVEIPKGQVITKKIEFSSLEISRDHKFEIEVNPNKAELETKPSGDAYADNKKSTSIDFVQYDPSRGCLTKRETSNTWKEKITFSREYDYESSRYTGTCHHDDEDGDCTSDCHDEYEDYCVYTSKSVSVEETFSESYRIEKILARSKWSIDNKKGNDGWVDVSSGETLKVKAGYPVEIQVVSNYKSNRKSNHPSIPSEVYTPSTHHYNSSNHVDVSDEPRDLKMTEVNQNTYIKINGYTKGFIQMDTKSMDGNPYNATATRQLPERPNMSGNDTVNAFYTTRPGTIKVDVITNSSGGYGPSNVIGDYPKTLQDCKSFTIEVIQNNDLGSHITD